MESTTNLFSGIQHLYHGSKSGIEGDIMPCSRDKCDFGTGFYMGTNKMQALTLICNFEEPILYNVDLDTADLKVLSLGADVRWAMFVAYNRGKLESYKGTRQYTELRNMRSGVDVITGPIADDRMFVVLRQFFDGEITDKALIACLSLLNLGDQWVAFTEKACNNILVTAEQHLSQDYREQLKLESDTSRSKASADAVAICKSHRRDGKFFDEIVEELFS